MMEPPSIPIAGIFKIQVHVYPPGTGRNLNVVPKHNFTLAKNFSLPLPELTIQQLCEVAKKRFHAIYHEPLFSIDKSQDSSGSDLYLQDRVGDIFANGEIFKIVQGSSIRDSVQPDARRSMPCTMHGELLAARTDSVQPYYPSIGTPQSLVPDVGSNWQSEARQEASTIDPDQPIRSHERDMPTEDPHQSWIMDAGNTEIPETQDLEIDNSDTEEVGEPRREPEKEPQRGSSPVLGTLNQSVTYDELLSTETLLPNASAANSNVFEGHHSPSSSYQTNSRDRTFSNGSYTQIWQLPMTSRPLQSASHMERQVSMSTAVTSPMRSSPSSNKENSSPARRKLIRPTVTPSRKRLVPVSRTFDDYDDDEDPVRTNFKRAKASSSMDVDASPPPKTPFVSQARKSKSSSASPKVYDSKHIAYLRVTRDSDYHGETTAPTVVETAQVELHHAIPENQGILPEYQQNSDEPQRNLAREDHEMQQVEVARFPLQDQEMKRKAEEERQNTLEKHRVEAKELKKIEADVKLKQEADKKAKLVAAAKEKAEAMAKNRRAAEQRVKDEAAAKAKRKADREAKEVFEANLKAEAERVKQKAEEETQRQLEATRLEEEKERVERDRRQFEEHERKEARLEQRSQKFSQLRTPSPVLHRRPWSNLKTNNSSPAKIESPKSAPAHTAKRSALKGSCTPLLSCGKSVGLQVTSQGSVEKAKPLLTEPPAILPGMKCTPRSDKKGGVAPQTENVSLSSSGSRSQPSTDVLDRSLTQTVLVPLKDGSESQEEPKRIRAPVPNKVKLKTPQHAGSLQPNSMKNKRVQETIREPSCISISSGGEESSLDDYSDLEIVKTPFTKRVYSSSIGDQKASPRQIKLKSHGLGLTSGGTYMPSALPVKMNTPTKESPKSSPSNKVSTVKEKKEELLRDAAGNESKTSDVGGGLPAENIENDSSGSSAEVLSSSEDDEPQKQTQTPILPRKTLGELCTQEQVDKQLLGTYKQSTLPKSSPPILPSRKQDQPKSLRRMTEEVLKNKPANEKNPEQKQELSKKLSHPQQLSKKTNETSDYSVTEESDSEMSSNDEQELAETRDMFSNDIDELGILPHRAMDNKASRENAKLKKMTDWNHIRQHFNVIKTNTTRNRGM